MFTGLIEEVGIVTNINMGSNSGTIDIQAEKIFENTKIGDSIAVNGVCLTVTKLKGKIFEADVMAETFRRSSLGKLKSASYVNLERAMAADGRFGGHIVSGHIDGTGIISNVATEENAIWYTVETDKKVLRYIVEKGSIAIDGISLTVAYVDDRCFKVSIIPHTKSETILQYKSVGDIVNLECDIIGKYVEKLMMFQGDNDKTAESNVTLELLTKCGF